MTTYEERSMLIGLTGCNVTCFTPDGDTFTVSRQGTPHLYEVSTTLTGSVVEVLANNAGEYNPGPLNHYYSEIEEEHLLEFLRLMGGPDLRFNVSFI